jgi:hypothetical protein
MTIIMPKIKVQIWHNINGEIIAVGRPVAPYTRNLGVIPKCTYDQMVLESEINEENIKDLHRTHIVDVEKQILVTYKKP